jgi:hypothetical protein
MDSTGTKPVLVDSPSKMAESHDEPMNSPQSPPTYFGAPLSVSPTSPRRHLRSCELQKVEGRRCGEQWIRHATPIPTIFSPPGERLQSVKAAFLYLICLFSDAPPPEPLSSDTAIFTATEDPLEGGTIFQWPASPSCSLPNRRASLHLGFAEPSVDSPPYKRANSDPYPSARPLAYDKGAASGKTENDKGQEIPPIFKYDLCSL